MSDVGIPDKPAYFMAIAETVARRANCKGRKVGAVLIRGDRIVSTGYNGTPSGMKNCLDGGCHRCSRRELYPAGEAYDLCVCVHAEQNAILAAARYGISLDGCDIYTTCKPCFDCAKSIKQAGLGRVFYRDGFTYNEPTVEQEYQRFLAATGVQLTQFGSPSPEPAPDPDPPQMFEATPGHDARA